MQWERARVLVKRLEELKIVEPASPGLRVGKSPATFVLCDPVDIDVPHAFVNGLEGKGKIGGVAGGVRIFDPKYFNSADPEAKKVWATALVVLLHCYRLHNLMQWGGVDHDALRQNWLMTSTPSGRGFKISASRDTNGDHNFGRGFYDAIMHSLGVAPVDHHAWLGTLKLALKLLSDSGLVYETVTLLDKNHRPFLPVRINDMHAALSVSEPSFIERFPGAGFYTHHGNESGEPESVWFTLHRDPVALGYTLAGVTRLRFRCSNTQTAQGLKRDAANMDKLRTELLAADLIDDL